MRHYTAGDLRKAKTSDVIARVTDPQHVRDLAHDLASASNVTSLTIDFGMTPTPDMGEVIAMIQESPSLHRVSFKGFVFVSESFVNRLAAQFKAGVSRNIEIDFGQSTLESGAMSALRKLLRRRNNITLTQVNAFSSEHFKGSKALMKQDKRNRDFQALANKLAQAQTRLADCPVSYNDLLDLPLEHLTHAEHNRSELRNLTTRYQAVLDAGAAIKAAGFQVNDAVSYLSNQPGAKLPAYNQLDIEKTLNKIQYLNAVNDLYFTGDTLVQRGGLGSDDRTAGEKAKAEAKAIWNESCQYLADPGKSFSDLQSTVNSKAIAAHAELDKPRSAIMKFLTRLYNAFNNGNTRFLQKTTSSLAVDRIESALPALQR